MGSNLNNPCAQLGLALSKLNLLPFSTVVKVSSFYQSSSILSGQPDYINSVVAIKSGLLPMELLRALQSIENSQGRTRQERWGARTLDLDILIFNDQIINNPFLQVPHPSIQDRPFVMYPLIEIAKESFVFPDGRQLGEIASLCFNLDTRRLSRI